MNLETIKTEYNDIKHLCAEILDGKYDNDSYKIERIVNFLAYIITEGLSNRDHNLFNDITLDEMRELRSKLALYYFNLTLEATSQSENQCKYNGSEYHLEYRLESLKQALDIAKQTGLFKPAKMYENLESCDIRKDLLEVFNLSDEIYDYIMGK